MARTRYGDLLAANARLRQKAQNTNYAKNQTRHMAFDSRPLVRRRATTTSPARSNSRSTDARRMYRKVGNI